MRRLRNAMLALSAATISVAAPAARAQPLSGELKRWHAVALTVDGPASSETARSNPFLNYRMDVTFTAPSGKKLRVPGFFAGDGQGGATGNKWRAMLCPAEVGQWSYQISFLHAPGAAVSDSPSPPGRCGTFRIAPSDKEGRDFRSGDQGLITAGPKHYLRLAGSSRPWLKGGPDIPENFLGYVGFDNTPRTGHRFAAHVKDWKPGDPDWGGGKGKAIIGALNYVASTGCNCIYFLPMNLGGDGQDTFPFVDPDEKTRYDLSKLAQWEIVFAHAQTQGIFLHFQLAETEKRNENFLGRDLEAGDDGDFITDHRRLFFRELVARFAHHPGLQWNLGEENDFTDDERRSFAACLRELDPYRHPITNHTKSNRRAVEQTYRPMLGNEDITMMSIQTHMDGPRLAALVEKWRKLSAQASHPWVVSVDEGQRVKNTDDADDGYPSVRTHWVWPAYMSGAGGYELYVKSKQDRHSLDQRLDDFREMDAGLRYIGHALAFMETLPLEQMQPANDLVAMKVQREFQPQVLALAGKVYAIYMPRTADGPCVLNLKGQSGKTFELDWYDPTTGRFVKRDSIEGGDNVVLRGPQRKGKTSDWAVRIRFKQ